MANSNKDLIHYLGKEIWCIVDHPLGSKHLMQGFTYLVNYGHLHNTVSGDGELIDVYMLGIYQPLLLGEEIKMRVIAVVDREDDDKQKLVALPVDYSGPRFSRSIIEGAIYFREGQYRSTIIMEGDVNVS